MKKMVPADLLLLIARDLGLEWINTSDVSYVHLEDMVADQVAFFLEKKPETLFSLLYRLDVSESKVKEVMNSNATIPKNIQIARLIIKRQTQRIETKRSIKVPRITDIQSF